MGEYINFIDSVRKKRENKWFDGSERHHIQPRCIGGIDSENNLIYLTHEEHFIAHKLLHEENPDDNKLLYALWMMSNRGESNEIDYANARKEFSRMMSERFSGEGNPMYKGRAVTDEYRLKMSESTRGNKNGFYGKHHSDATKKVMSEKKKDIYFGESNPFYGKHHSEETRRKMSISHSKPRGPRNKKLSYRLICKSCSNKFLGNSPSQKICDVCKVGGNR